MTELGYDSLAMVRLTSSPRLGRDLELEVRIRMAEQLAAQTKAAEIWRVGREGGSKEGGGRRKRIEKEESTHLADSNNRGRMTLGAITNMYVYKYGPMYYSVHTLCCTQMHTPLHACMCTSLTQ